ncbi:MAG: glycosyltransferase family 39 protein [Chloroflexi bacterium]|nr:glycosyltransferase family 39 protein [Chloroflexota bacterium]
MTERRFEDLSLTQALWLLVIRPARTIQLFLDVVVDSEEYPFETRQQGDFTYERRDTETPQWVQSFRIDRFINLQYLWRIGWLGSAIVLMILGADSLFDAALDPLKKAEGDTGSAFFWIPLSIVVFLIGYLFIERDSWLPRVQRRFGNVDMSPVAEPAVKDVESKKPQEELVARRQPETFDPSLTGFLTWFIRHSLRFMLVPIAILLSWYAYDRNTLMGPQGEVVQVVFTRQGLQSWFGAIALWYIIFTVDLNGAFVAMMRGKFSPDIRWNEVFRWRWTHVVLILIVLLGASFRLRDLDSIPPDMTSDHIEKLRDAIRIDEGYYAMFFDNNGGREAFQMYVVQQIATTFGVGFNFRALKYASIIEGLLTIVLIYVMVKTVIGRMTKDRDRLGDWVGLAAAGFLAISSWHTTMSRLGLRIPLTPLATAIVVIFLVRAIRYNKRWDFVNLGLALGIGLYWYQANRTLPAVAVVLVGLAILFSLNRPRYAARYAVNFAMAGILAIVIYLPMYHYSEAFPGEFWSRTYGRVYGDGVYIYEYDPATGEYEFNGPSTVDLIEHVYEHRDTLIDNYEDAFKMWSWDGDPAWFHNPLGKPAFDPITNAFFMLGAAMWVVLMVRYREIALLVVPIGIVVMMLPTTLAVSTLVNENPSFTRLSGTMPFVFLLAGLPLGWLAYDIVRTGYTRVLFFGLALLVGGYTIVSAIEENEQTYFEEYRVSYERSWKPYNAFADPLQTFVEGRGSFGNAFYVHSEHWLDHRIVGAMAGDVNWPNSLLDRGDVYLQMRINEGTSYEYNPDQPLYFMFDLEDVESITFFEQAFPGGTLTRVPVRDDNDFYIYEAPAGWGWIRAFISEQTKQTACIVYCGYLR